MKLSWNANNHSILIDSENTYEGSDGRNHSFNPVTCEGVGVGMIWKYIQSLETDLNLKNDEIDRLTEIIDGKVDAQNKEKVLEVIRRNEFIPAIRMYRTLNDFPPIRFSKEVVLEWAEEIGIQFEFLDSRKQFVK